MNIELDYSGRELDKYYLIEKLGNGGFGAVYKARDRILNVEKAINKNEVTNPNEAFKLFNEAAIPYKCQHNHIIKINGGEIINFENELLFVVDMDLANGNSVDNILRKEFLSVVDSLNIIKGILFAVEHSHIKNIIHRDIKPANILIDSGIPKLSDFGLSTALGSLIMPWKWYRPHAAPETFDNHSIATVESDIYALGMTLYRMVNSISDWHLFLQNIPNVDNLIKSGKLIDKLPRAPYVHKKVHKIIRKACRLDPRERYHSASEMRNEIERLRFHYNWKRIEDDSWEGTSTGYTTKKLCIKQTIRSTNVIVTNNGRKSAQDSRRFNDISEAHQYLFEYIMNTTFL